MKLRRWPYLLNGSILMLFLGLIYAWSIFVTPLEAEFGWTRAQSSLTFTISMSMFLVGMITGGWFSKKKSARLTSWFAAAFILVGFCLASRVNTLIGIYLAYGVLCGFGVGLCYNALMSSVMRWFPDAVGRTSGTLLMGFGLGSLVLGSAASALIGAIGWRTTFLIIGIAFGVLVPLSSILIVPPGKDVVLPENKHIKKQNLEEGLSLAPLQLLKRPSFWLYFIWITVLTAAGLAFIGHASPSAKGSGATEAMATLLVGIVSVCNGAGRVLWGASYDFLGRAKTMLFINLGFIAALVMLIGAVWFNAVALFFVGGVLMGISYGGVPSSNAVVANSFYGKEHYAVNFGMLSASLVPASLLGPGLAGALQTASGSYLSTFIVLIALSAIALVLRAFVRKP